MNSARLVLLLFCVAAAHLAGADAPRRRDNLVILDAMGVENLRIQTMVTEPGEFEETVFALGRIEVYPGRRAVISSRIPGRALEVFLKPDHAVRQGEIALTIESRQVGDPPPTVKLTAPMSGLVSALQVVPGQPVTPDDVLAEILDLSEVYALARVPEHLASRLKPGQAARITAPAVAGATFEAALEHFGATADPESGTIEAAFHVPNPQSLLRPGMRAEFSIVVEKRSGVVSVPRTALQGDPASRFVYVRDFDLPNAFLKTPVVVGRSNERSVEILRGLLPYDEVVVQGAYSLAFAGGGNVSLKEALDAAHGHAHNPDGSEMAPGQGGTPAGAAGTSAAAGHPHDDHHRDDSLFWQIVSGVLLVLLIAVGVMKRPREPGGGGTRASPSRD